MILVQSLLLATLVFFILGIIFPSNWFDIATTIFGISFVLALFLSMVCMIIGEKCIK